MRKRIVVVVALSVLLAVSAFAQTTGFFKLVESGTPEEIQAAISNGADVNAPNVSDYFRMTPLMYAAISNPNPAVITTLLAAGANVNAKSSSDDDTALICAAQGCKNPEVITVLLKAGADIEAREINGMTALMWAASNPNPEVIMTLLKAGADTKARSTDGKTASDYAIGSGLLTGTEALRQLSESQPPGTKLISTDGHFALYVPNEGAPMTAEQVASNKNLFALMESQVKHRPVMVSFDGWMPGSFLKWMLATYGSDLADYWGSGSGAEATASYFLDKTEDNDFVIDVRSRYSSTPGMEILVMTWEYFMATR